MTITLNARTDLTYEEIYEGYANGKSRLPKIIKQIENGELALAEDTGIDIKRRRTSGGNAETPGNVGQTDSTVVAKLISAARWDALVAGYSGASPYNSPPSANIQTVNVRAVVKEPFDLIDQVAGINFAEQSSSSVSEGQTDQTGREAKIQEKGTGVRIREIDARAPAGGTADIDVQDFFANDRIGGGGATGEVHGVDQGIPEVVAADSEAVQFSTTGATFNMASDTTLSFRMSSEGANVDVVFPAAILTAQEVANTINAAAAASPNLAPGIPPGDKVALVNSAPQVELHSRLRGLEDQLIREGDDPQRARIQVTEANSVLGFSTSTTVGATVGDVDGVIDQQIVDLDPSAGNARTTLRYGTAQFGVIEIVGTTNGLVAATPSAYILHPDHLEDLIAFNP